MKSLTSIFNFKKLVLWLLIFVMIMPVLNHPLTVNAVDGTITEGDAAEDGTYTSSGGFWYATFPNKCGYVGQGILIYLLEKEGGGPVAGTMPKAYACNKAIQSLELRAQDKYNRYPMVTSFEGTPIYWADTVRDSGGLMHTSTESNVKFIKEWLQTPYGDGTKGINMVETIWGPAVSQRFTNEEIFLVVEPIIGTKFALYTENYWLKGMDTNVSFATLLETLKKMRDSFKNNPNTGYSDDLMEFLNNRIKTLESPVPLGVKEQVRVEVAEFLKKMKQSFRYYSPYNGKEIAGTSKEVIKYFDALPNTFGGMTKSASGIGYYNKGANLSTTLSVGSKICSNANFVLYDQSFSLKQNNPLDRIQTYSIGMAAMLAWGDDGQTTCDEPEQPSPHQPPQESKGKCTIIKSYREKDDVTGAYTDHGTYYRQQVANKIIIENESEFKLKAWKTSSSPNLNISSITWETSVPAVIGQTGTAPTTIELPDGQPYLYLLLEKSKGEIDAHYLLSQSSVTRHVLLSTPDTWKAGGKTIKNITSEVFKFSIAAHTRTACGGHSYTDSCTNSCPGDHPCNKKCYDPNTPDDTSDDYCPNNHTCSGCECGGHTDKCDWGEWTKQKLKMALKNTKLTSEDENHWVINTKGQDYVSRYGQSLAFTHEVTRTSRNSLSWEFTNLDYHCLIHRGYTQVIVAEWKNKPADKTSLANTSDKVYKVSNTLVSRSNRKKSDYKANFVVKIGDASPNKKTQRDAKKAAPHSGGACSETTTLKLENPSNTIKPSVKVLVYLGKQSANGKTGDTSTPGEYTYDKSNVVISGHSVKSGTISNFLPYVQMKYDTLNAKDLKVYILGEYARSFNLNSYAEVEWKRPTSPNLNLTSLQWSTHAEANKSHKTGTVLPGGATLTLSIPSANKQIVTVRSYQPILAGDGLSQVTKTGGTSQLTDDAGAKQAHLDYVETVRASLDKLHLQYYADNVDYGLNFANRDNARDVIDDPNNLADYDKPTKEGLGGSKESKYYFSMDNSGTSEISGEGDLDARVKSSSVSYLTVWCDTAGNIRLQESNSLATASKIKNNNERQSSSDSNIVCKRTYNGVTMEWTGNAASKKAKELDKKTGIITKMINELEKGGGADLNALWATDGKWYNEAFDGVTYVVWTSELNVEFANPTERLSVLDPKLCPVNAKGQQGMFKSFYTAQIKLEDNVLGNNNQKVGVFTDPASGQSTDVKMTDMDMLYWSREFYVPNVTTQDLN